MTLSRPFNQRDPTISQRVEGSQGRREETRTRANNTEQGKKRGVMEDKIEIISPFLPRFFKRLKNIAQRNSHGGGKKRNFAFYRLRKNELPRRTRDVMDSSTNPWARGAVYSRVNRRVSTFPSVSPNLRITLSERGSSACTRLRAGERASGTETLHKDANGRSPLETRSIEYRSREGSARSVRLERAKEYEGVIT